MAENFDKPHKKKHQRSNSGSKKKDKNPFSTRGKRSKSTKIILRKSYVEDDGYFEGGTK